MIALINVSGNTDLNYYSFELPIAITVGKDFNETPARQAELSS